MSCGSKDQICFLHEGKLEVNLLQIAADKLRFAVCESHVFHTVRLKTANLKLN
jgi:galactokinase